MKIIFHELNGLGAAEIVSDSVVLEKVQDALDLMVKPEISSPKKIILQEKNINPAFFDLSTRLAGEILQKFVNYRVQLAIVGDFADIKSDSLKAFIAECNRGRQVFFVESIEAAKKALMDS